jgi:hypothetical protein
VREAKFEKEAIEGEDRQAQKLGVGQSPLLKEQFEEGVVMSD